MMNDRSNDITKTILIPKTPLKRPALEKTFSPLTGTHLMSPVPATPGVYTLLVSFSEVITTLLC